MKLWITRGTVCSTATTEALRLWRIGAASMALLPIGLHAALPDEHEASRARWASIGADSYEYAYHKFCECHGEAPPETVVTVRDDEIVRVHHRHEGSGREVPAREGSLAYYWTVEDLFALIEAAAERDATVRARYDAERGHPVHVFIDYDPALVGDEIDVRLTRLDLGSP